MAQTIKQMAQARKMDLFLGAATIPEIYEQGAMDVLNVIETILVNGTKYSQIYKELKCTIKELKGE